MVQVIEVAATKADGLPQAMSTVNTIRACRIPARNFVCSNRLRSSTIPGGPHCPTTTCGQGPTIMRAIALRDPKPGLIFHSDRGIEYSAYDYHAFLRSRGIVPSSFTSDAELNAALATYIDRFYNQNAFIPAWGTIPRSSMNAWPMPSEVSTKADEDHSPARGVECRA